MTAVVAVAVRFGLWPSLVAVLAASLCYNFFFIPPLYTFTVADPANVAALIFFTIVALLVSNLAAHVRTQARHGPGPGSDHGGALCVQPQARRRGHRSMTCSGRAPIRSPRC